MLSYPLNKVLVLLKTKLLPLIERKSSSEKESTRYVGLVITSKAACLDEVIVLKGLFYHKCKDFNQDPTHKIMDSDNGKLLFWGA